MKTGELCKLLRKAGCSFVEHRGKHDYWFSPITGKEFAVWRHSGEIPTGTVDSILIAAGLK